jgi:hypothetical protein
MIGMKAKDVPCTIGSARRPGRSDGLEQRRDTGKEHRHLDHVDHFGKIGAVRAEAETRRAADDDRRVTFDTNIASTCWMPSGTP